MLSRLFSGLLVLTREGQFPYRLVLLKLQPLQPVLLMLSLCFFIFDTPV